MRVNRWFVYFWHCVTSLINIHDKSIHFLSNFVISFFFRAEYISFYAFTPNFHYSFICWQLGWFKFCSSNRAAINKGTNISMRVCSVLWVHPRSEIARPYHSSIFNFFWLTSKIDFHNTFLNSSPLTVNKDSSLSTSCLVCSGFIGDSHTD